MNLKHSNKKETDLFKDLNLSDSSGIGDLFLNAFYQDPTTFFLIHDCFQQQEAVQIRLINQKARDLLSLPKSGKSLPSIFAIVPREDIDKLLMENLKPGQIKYMDRKFLDSGGEILIISSLNLCFDSGIGKIVFCIGPDITSRTLRHQKLKYNEYYYRKLVRNLPGTDIHLIDRDLNIVLSDGSEMVNYGRNPSDFENKPLKMVVSEEVFSRIHPYLKKAFLNQSVKAEIHYGDQWYQYHFRFIDDFENRDGYCMLLIRNITEEREFQERNRLLSAIIDNSNNHASIKDLDLRFIAANQALVRDSGLSSEKDFLGKTDIEVFGDHPHIRKYMENEKKAQFLSPGESLTFEEEFITPQGESRYSLTKKFPVFREDTLIATANISLDITELRQTQNKLEESEKKYKLLVENQGEGIGIVDENEVFTYANEKGEEIFGVKKGQLKGRYLTDFLDNKNFKLIEKQILLRKKGTKSSYEVMIRDAMGNLKYLLVTATPYFDEKKNFSGTYAIFRDITTRKLTEKALKDSEEKLRVANQDKDRLFSIIGHDLRNPFNTVLSITSLIIEEFEEMDRENLMKYLRLIQVSSINSMDLLENLLQWSSSKTGKINFQPEILIVSDLVRETMQLVNESALVKDIQIINEIDTGMEVKADRNMLKTIFRNLITNAIKFSYPGGKIILSGMKKKDFVEFSVKDFGIGMSEEILNTLVSGNNSKSRTGTAKENGSGLGLTLCYDFLKKHQGGLTIKSSPGKGAEFLFTLNQRKIS